MNRAFRGIWIPAELWLADDLTHTQKFLLAEIDSLDNEKGCFANNHHFAKFLDLNKMYVSQLISSLQDKEYIYIEYVNQKRIIHSNIKKLFGQKVVFQEPEKDDEQEHQDGIKYKEETATAMLVLRTVDGFFKAWSDFVAYRKEKKKPITKIGEKRLMDKLAKFHSEGFDIIAAMNQSIDSGWTDVWPKVKTADTYKNNATNEQSKIFDGQIKVR